MNTTVADILERCRKTGTRVILSYAGKDGVDWLEDFDTDGYVGMSCGRSPAWLLLPNSRSHGGCAISIDSIARIRESRGKFELYRRPGYRQPLLTMHRCRLPGLPIEVRSNGKAHARFKSERAAAAWAKKLGVEIGGAS